MPDDNARCPDVANLYRISALCRRRIQWTIHDVEQLIKSQSSCYSLSSSLCVKTQSVSVWAEAESSCTHKKIFMRGVRQRFRLLRKLYWIKKPFQVEIEVPGRSDKVKRAQRSLLCADPHLMIRHVSQRRLLHPRL